MRRAVLALLGLLLAAGCHRDSPSTPDVQQYIDELNTTTDPQKLDELAQKVYACGPNALPLIGEALNQIDYKAKPQLIAAVSAMPDDRAIGMIDKQLHSHTLEARLMACQGLALHATPLLWDASANLQREDDADREWAMHVMIQCRDDARKWVYKNSLSDKDEYVRAQALVGLRTIDPSFALPLVKPRLSDPSPLVRNEAFLTMCKLAPKDPAITAWVDEMGKKALASTGEESQSFALLLGATGHPKAEPYLSQMMGGPDPRVRAAAAFAYGNLGKAASSKRLMHSFQTDPDYGVREQAARSIARLGSDDVEQDLVGIVWGKDRKLAALALDTLVDLDRPNCIGPLMGVAEKFPNLAFKREAAAGLSNQAIGKSQVRLVEDIVAMAGAQDAGARKDAAMLLAHLQGPRFYVKLQEMMRDPDPGVRVIAMESLKRQTHLPRTWPRPMQHPLPSWLEGVE